MVLFVHGGPWGRDHWRLDPYVQWLANRGYAVLQVNFRASTGYGRKFMNAGDRQWGKDMQTDLLDAVDWAVKEGVAEKGRVAIMGGSYGGYATLAAAAFSPDVFRCGVDIVGPSNLFTLLRSIPPYWKPMRAMFDRRIGNIDDPADKALLESASPLFSAEKIRMPLLIGQGANDPRVKQAESEQIVARAGEARARRDLRRLPGRGARLRPARRTRWTSTPARRRSSASASAGASSRCKASGSPARPRW